MSRTLHVIDQPGETAEAAVLRLSFDAARLDPKHNNDQHAWLLFGGEATRDAARSIGLRDDQFRLLPKPVGLHKLLPASLAKPKQFMDQAHRVACWTEGAAQIASLLGCANVVRRINDAALCPFAQRIIEQAAGEASSDPNPTRASLRERWGVEEGTTVVALLGDRFDHIDASAAMMAVVLAREALAASHPNHADVRLLCHPQAKRRADAAIFSEMLSLDRLLIQEAAIASPWSALPGSDIAIVMDPTHAGLSALWAQALGTPILSPPDARLPMLDSLSTFVPARSRQPKHLADALTAWAGQQTPQTTCR